MEKFRIYSKEDGGKWEYTITVEKTDAGTHYTLYRSETPSWTYPGEKIMSAFDNGNGINFSKSINCKVDYSDFAELFVLYSFISKYDSQLMSQYEMIGDHHFISL
jgi:hypothetical protein